MSMPGLSQLPTSTTQPKFADKPVACIPTTISRPPVNPAPMHNARPDEPTTACDVATHPLDLGRASLLAAKESLHSLSAKLKAHGMISPTAEEMRKTLGADVKGDSVFTAHSPPSHGDDIITHTHDPKTGNANTVHQFEVKSPFEKFSLSAKLNARGMIPLTKEEYDKTIGVDVKGKSVNATHSPSSPRDDAFVPPSHSCPSAEIKPGSYEDLFADVDRNRHQRAAARLRLVNPVVQPNVDSQGEMDPKTPAPKASDASAAASHTRKDLLENLLRSIPQSTTIADPEDASKAENSLKDIDSAPGTPKVANFTSGQRFTALQQSRPSVTPASRPSSVRQRCEVYKDWSLDGRCGKDTIPGKAICAEHHSRFYPTSPQLASIQKAQAEYFGEGLDGPPKSNYTGSMYESVSEDGWGGFGGCLPANFYTRSTSESIDEDGWGPRRSYDDRGWGSGSVAPTTCLYPRRSISGASQGCKPRMDDGRGNAKSNASRRSASRLGRESWATNSNLSEWEDYAAQLESKIREQEVQNQQQAGIIQQQARVLDATNVQQPYQGPIATPYSNGPAFPTYGATPLLPTRGHGPALPTYGTPVTNQQAEVEFLNHCLSSATITPEDRHKALEIISSIGTSAKAIGAPGTPNVFITPSNARQSTENTPAHSNLDMKMQDLSKTMTKMHAFNKFQRQQQDSDRLARIEAKMMEPEIPGLANKSSEQHLTRLDRIEAKLSRIEDINRQNFCRDVGSEIENLRQCVEQIASCAQGDRDDILSAANDTRYNKVPGLYGRIQDLSVQIERLDAASRSKTNQVDLAAPRSGNLGWGANSDKFGATKSGCSTCGGWNHGEGHYEPKANNWGIPTPPSGANNRFVVHNVESVSRGTGPCCVSCGHAASVLVNGVCGWCECDSTPSGGGSLTPPSSSHDEISAHASGERSFSPQKLAQRYGFPVEYKVGSETSDGSLIGNAVPAKSIGTASSSAAWY